MKHHGWAAWFVAGSLVVPSVATAGSGYIADGKLNLSVMFTYHEAEIDAWRPVFDEASRLLFNATNGQLQLGTIRVTNCGYDNENADIWILNDNSGAFANPLGLSGEGHIFISQTHRDVTSTVFGPFGVVHEIGHYAMGLYDEYKGVEVFLREGVAEQTEHRLLPNQFCTTDLDQVACVMDGGTTIQPNNGRTEFCTHTDGGLTTAHNDGNEFGGALYVNSQQVINQESCWETINRVLALESPSTVDISDPPGLDPIDWEIVSNVSRVVLCLDRSSSILGDGLEFSKGAAMEMADLLHGRKTIVIDGSPVVLPGEETAVVSFATTATADFPIQEVVDQNVKDAIRASIDAIEGAGLTQLGAGLRTSLEEIVGQSDTPSCGEAIIVFTDGQHVIGEPPADVIPDLQARGVKVFAVGVGYQVDEELLLNLVTETGGTLYDAENADDLPGIFAEILSSVRSGGVSTREAGTTAGENHTIGFLANGLGEEVSNVLHWDEGMLDLTLTSPTGDVIDVESAATREDVEAVRREGFLYIRVIAPELGEWSGLIEAIEVPDVTAWEVTTLFEGPAVNLTVTTDKDSYEYPEMIHIRADLIGNVPVAGATVSAVVDRPVSGPFEIELLDNGNATNGDAFANDGVYTAIFDRYPKTGLYTFHVTATNVDGSGPNPDLPFVEDGADPPETIPPFTREAQASVYVLNVPPPRPSWLYFPLGSVNVGTGEALTCYLELLPPESVEDVILESVALNEVVSPAELPTIGDINGNGIPDLRIEFTLEDLLVAVPPQMGAEVELSGLMLDGETVFEYSSRINVIDATDAVAVSPLPVVTGELAIVNWNATEGELMTYDGYLSHDGGASWQPLFTDHTGGPEFSWIVTAGVTEGAQVLVEARDPEMVRAHSISNLFEIVDNVVDVPDVPLITRFQGVTPNPSHGAVVLQYSLADRADVNLDIYDVSGRLVRRLVSEAVSTGSYRVTWDGRDGQGHTVSTGVYLYRFEAGPYRQTGRIMLMK